MSQDEFLLPPAIPSNTARKQSKSRLVRAINR